MRVHDLIEQLNQFPPDRQLVVPHQGGGFTTAQVGIVQRRMASILDHEASDGSGELVEQDDGVASLSIEPKWGVNKKYRRLFLCHVPKTAGGALSQSIRSLFEVNQVFDFESIGPMFRMTDRDLARARLILGHSGAWLARRLPRDTLTMTVLRDPVKRVLSTYNYFLAKGVIEPGIKEFVASSTNYSSVNNVMAWQMAHDSSQLARRDEPFRDWDEDTLKTAALGALHRFNIIGVAEQLDEVLTRLEVVYERRPTPMQDVNRVKKDVEKLSDEETEIIRSHTRIDQAIYDEALAIKDAVWERTKQLITSHKPTNLFL